MEESALGRPFLSPRLEGGKLLESRQVIAAASGHQFLNRGRLRQMGQQALGRLLVLGEIPHAPEIRKEGRKAALRTRWEAMGPALRGNIRCVASCDGPCARGVHDQRAVA